MPTADKAENTAHAQQVHSGSKLAPGVWFPCGEGERAHLQASTTLPEVKRHGSGAYLVAIWGRAPVFRMNSPMNSSLYPNPYTCRAQTPT